jgi:hypothetical protein
VNATNRGLNRLLILVVGLVLVVIGAAALAVVTVPVVADWWRDNRSGVLDTIDGWFAWNPFAAAPGADAGQAAPIVVPIAGIVLLVLVAALLISFVLRQGRGRSGIVHRSAVEHGDIVLETDVVANALSDALDDTEAFSSVRVSSWDVKRAQASVRRWSRSTACSVSSCPSSSRSAARKPPSRNACCSDGHRSGRAGAIASPRPNRLIRSRASQNASVAGWTIGTHQRPTAIRGRGSNTMGKKILLIIVGLVAFGAYTLGAKAGQTRYREIKHAAEEFWNDPRVEKARKKAVKNAKKATAKAQKEVQKKLH